MMSRHGIRFKVTCKTAEVLARLTSNRESHVALVREATDGYLKNARLALEKRLGQIVEGRVVPLSFSLPPPQDYTSVYDTAIGMLLAHQDDTVVLEADEFRNLMEDQWEWSAQFALVNAAYSPATRNWGAQKGLASTEFA